MNVTTCADIAEDLSLHAAGEPSREVDLHLAVCVECRQRHAELRALCGALFALRMEPETAWIVTAEGSGLRRASPLSTRTPRCESGDGSPQSRAFGEEPVVRFDFRRALWPLVIAAGIAIALWPSAPNPPAPAPVAPTWFALQRAALADEGALDRALAVQTAAFTATLHAAAQAGPLNLAQLEP